MKGFRQKPGGGSQLEQRFQQAVRWHAEARLTEAAESFESILKSGPTHFGSLHRLAAIRRQQGNVEEALALLKTALRCNPRSPDAHNSLGNTLAALAKHAAAIDCFRQALALRPDYPEAHSNMGNSFHAMGRNQEAAACYGEALALRPAYSEAHSNLGNMLTLLRRPEEALGCFQTALRLNPRSGPAHSNLGNALMALNRHEEASQAFGRACELDPDLPQPRFNHAIAKLALGDYQAGWLDFEARRSNRDRRFPQPRWDGRSDIAGKTILLHFEQGLGDTIQFARYAALPAERGARVIFEVPKPLIRLFATLAGPAQLIAEGDPLPDFDFHVPLLSLPLAFQTTLESIPSPGQYLHAAGAANSRIGLCWAGNPGYANDHNRSIPLNLLPPLLDIPGARFLSLQKNLRDGDEAILASHPNVDVHSDRQGKDFADTAALIAGMDLVITVDTAIAHLAGALGRPVWILLPFSAHWAWLRGRGDSPWYPSARLFRQPKIGDWETVVAQLVTALTETIS